MTGSRARRWLATIGRATAVAAVLCAVPGGAAVAGSGDGLPGAVPSEATTEVVNRCVLYANASGFGADCAGGSSGHSIKDVLGKDPFPECRYDLLPADMSAPDTHADEPGAWYLVTCLKGIKPDGTGDFTRTTEIQWFPVGKPVPTLTTNQNRAWSFFRSAYPTPQPQFGPATRPRVLIPTFFWLTDSSGATITRTVFDGTRDVPMKAYVDQIEVSPGRFADEKPLPPCKAPLYAYDHSRSIDDQRSTCRYEYDRSSAFMPDHRYAVTVQADWVVAYQQADGTWKRLGTFPLSNVFETPVDEIQTVAR